jgi:hypothetical protein
MAAFRASLAIAERLAEAEPGRADYQRDLSVSYGRLGDLQLTQGSIEDAVGTFDRCLATATAVWEKAPWVVDHVVDLAWALVRTASLRDEVAGNHRAMASELLGALGADRLPPLGRRLLAELRADNDPDDRPDVTSP